ncbi:MAG: hypothetical protein M1814_004489 [Vezdaea aestivalis]|nr:MAG: hypothetical protein M1814_004489 [Vezdaea aestivalis]
MPQENASSNPFRRSQRGALESGGDHNGAADSIFSFPVNPADSQEDADTDRCELRRTESSSKTVRVVSPPPKLSASDPSVKDRVPAPLHPRSEREIDSIGTSSSSSTSSESSPADPFEPIPSDTPRQATPVRSQGTIGQDGTGALEGKDQNLITQDGRSVQFASAAQSLPKERTYPPITESSRPAKPSTQSPRPSSLKGSMDIDTFTQMLLTGKPTGLGPQPSSNTVAQTGAVTGALVDSSSSTDASSISRQSIFDHTFERPAETPRSSHEINRSDDEVHRDRGSSGKIKERQKPPPPKPRHGRLLKDSPQNNSIITSSSSVQISRQSLVSAPLSSPTDLNKPLPTTPDIPTTTNEASWTPSRKRPPTPPIARRHSRIGKPPSIAEGSEFDDATSNTGSIAGLSRTSSLRVPPPPPTRRSGAPRNSYIGTPNYPSTPSSIVEISDNPIDVHQAQVSKRPPPPARSSSLSSTKRQSRHLASEDILPATSPSSSMAPPPPPPRRRRGSSKSSVETFERPESSRRGSRISLEPITPSDTRSSSLNTNELLEETSALQREIDELRGKFEREA